jgi:hypothetical protein
LPYVPGNAVEGYCLTCKADTVQTVLEVDGLQIRRVRCEKCKEEGPLRVPRSKTREGLLAVARKRNTIAPPKRRTRKKAADPAQEFRKLIEGKDLATALVYSVSMDMEAGNVISHPRFGHGVVTAITGPQKAVVVFEDGPKNLLFGKK